MELGFCADPLSDNSPLQAIARENCPDLRDRFLGRASGGLLALSALHVHGYLVADCGTDLDPSPG